MLSQNRELIAQELNEGTGATISARAIHGPVQSGLEVWFTDIERNRGPIIKMLPVGLKAHSVELTFGRFSGETIHQISRASDESYLLARALVHSITLTSQVSIQEQGFDSWNINDGSFSIKVHIRHINSSDTANSILRTSREVIVPLMASMAELIGYQEIRTDSEEVSSISEGRFSLALVSKRERNPRNRLLCLRIHGHKCAVCNIDLLKEYQSAGNTIEVHHIHPLALLEEEREYNPETDLVPLCPNCHRAVHTRKPVPISPEELRNEIKGFHA
jgi:5-methylcytosine-specific restriction protein A